MRAQMDRPAVVRVCRLFLIYLLLVLSWSLRNGPRLVVWRPADH